MSPLTGLRDGSPSLPWVPWSHPGLTYVALSALHCLLTIPTIHGRSGFPPFCPFSPCILRVSSADGALPSVDSSTNAISLDLSLGQYSLRSNTVWPRGRQVKARYRTQANRKQWDLSRGMRLIGILTLGSRQSPRADIWRTFSATLPSAHSSPSHRAF